jgi:hypothetical protein
MAEIEVLVRTEGVGGLVPSGASGDQAHSLSVPKIVDKVVKVSADKITDAVISLAEKIGPALQAKISTLSLLKIHEVSIGCAITVDGSVVVAGVGAEASLEITFKI